MAALIVPTRIWLDESSGRELRDSEKGQEDDREEPDHEVRILLSIAADQTDANRAIFQSGAGDHAARDEVRGVLSLVYEGGIRCWGPGGRAEAGGMMARV